MVNCILGAPRRFSKDIIKLVVNLDNQAELDKAEQLINQQNIVYQYCRLVIDIDLMVLQQKTPLPLKNFKLAATDSLVDWNLTIIYCNLLCILIH